MLRRFYHWLILILLAAIFLSACGTGEADQTPAVDELEVESGAGGLVSATGVVVPVQSASLSLNAAGEIAEILVDEGEIVQTGQPLIRLAGGSLDNPSPELQAAIQARELEVEAAQQALDNLDEQVESLKLQAEQVLNTTVSQIRDLQYRLDSLELPESQEGLSPIQAYDEALEIYENAQAAFEPYRDEPAGDTNRKERKEDLDDAKSDYDVSIARLQLSLALDSAEANRDQARQDWEKYRKGPSGEDLLQAVNRLYAAQAGLVAAQAAVDKLTLKAPFAGTVSEVNARVGEWIIPGNPVVILAELSNLQIETTDLNEIDMVRINVDDPVSISFDALPEVKVNGRIVSIALKASPGVGVNYKVIVKLDSIPEGLRWGMSAFVDILPQRSE